VAANVNNTREHPRLAVDAFVKIGDADYEYVFRTRDLSRSGVFLYTRVGHIYPFKVGATLHLELYDFDQSVTCRAVIVRVVEPGSPEADRYPTGFALRFTDLDADNRGHLERLLDRITKHGAPY
jgi:hypothetical protein